MINWNNMDTLEAFKELKETKKVNLREVMSGENGAKRASEYSVAMGGGLIYNYAAKAVDEDIITVL